MHTHTFCHLKYLVGKVVFFSPSDLEHQLITAVYLSLFIFYKLLLWDKLIIFIIINIWQWNLSLKQIASSELLAASILEVDFWSCSED